MKLKINKKFLRHLFIFECIISRKYLVQMERKQVTKIRLLKNLINWFSLEENLTGPNRFCQDCQ